MKYILPIVFFLLIISGCSYNREMVKEITQQSISPVIEQEIITVEEPINAEIPGPEYIIGPNDVVFVSVYGKPDWGTAALTSSGGKIEGSRIDGSGNIYLPLVGKVNVSGLTIDEARTKLKDAYQYYLKSPSVVIEMADYKSKPLYLMGQFKTPGTYYMDRPMKLLHGISLGQGLSENGNYRGARILRDGRVLPVDIYRLLREGDMSQNIWLRENDVIYVPDLKDQSVFVIGAVKKPGPVPMMSNNMTLLRALSVAGFDETLSYSRYVRIIRSYSPTRGALMVVDLEKIFNGETLDLPLMEGDIIHLAKSPIGTWNVALNEILPSLQAISAVLNPFVQIKYLTGN